MGVYKGGELDELVSNLAQGRKTHLKGGERIPPPLKMCV